MIGVKALSAEASTLGWPVNQTWPYKFLHEGQEFRWVDHHNLKEGDFMYAVYQHFNSAGLVDAVLTVFND